MVLLLLYITLVRFSHGVGCSCDSFTSIAIYCSILWSYFQFIYLHWNVHQTFGSIPVWSYPAMSFLVQDLVQSCMTFSKIFNLRVSIHRGYMYVYTHICLAYEFQTHPLYISNLIDNAQLLFQIRPIIPPQAVEFLLIYILTNTWYC